MGEWIDIEQQRPPEGERVIILIPFGMQVKDDTWTNEGWMNTPTYVSHWQPINRPGTYTEIMQRPKGNNPLPVPDPLRDSIDDSWFSPAVEEHYLMMDSMVRTQFKLRFEAK